MGTNFYCRKIDRKHRKMFSKDFSVNEGDLLVGLEKTDNGWKLLVDRLRQVEQGVKLIDEGNTIPFIARYRKEVTGNLSDETRRLCSSTPENETKLVEIEDVYKTITRKKACV